MAGRGARIASVLLSASLLGAGSGKPAPASAGPATTDSTAASPGRMALERGIALRKDRPADAAPILQEALRLLQSEGNLGGQAEARRNLGILERQAGRDDAALAHYQAALDLA
ncbi:MAG TPA: tetratricopeptide repeat protein, partial [Candidatus Polarisedimenticolia bacterium]|nr:tetratricopeptide repeat protein [Candidatus Polarisedimenticolia bacterium]